METEATKAAESLGIHDASRLFMTGNPPKPGEVAIINFYVIECACGFEARGKCWRDTGSIFDNHLWQKLKHT